ncbi:MAG: carboxypeptidase-like regulatory domain-containing protein, partial [Gemmatimonadota bacterium]|nr:carboxypeptidase-like regulatory domain-containing protein [Gemmatimonadota bacterium]
MDTGKIEGYVRDEQTGAPLAGAQISVEGTRLGNVANEDGYYFILNVPPGNQAFRASFTGYQVLTVKDVLIHAGHTATLNFILSSHVIELEGIVIQSQEEQLLVRDNTMSKQRQTGDEIQALPVSEIDDIIAMQAGVVRSGNKISLRGGRYGEEAVYVDGVLVKNFGSESTTGPILAKASFTQLDVHFQQQAPDNSPLDLGTNAVEEISIITGGFQAEYGDAKSGVVNIVTREGRNFYSGNILYRTDGVMPRSMDFGYNQLQAGLSGPVPFVPQVFFFASVDAQGRQDWSPEDTRDKYGFRRINQAVVDRMNEMMGPSVSRKAGLEELESHLATMGLPNPVRTPGSFGDRYSIQTKLTASPLSNLKFLQTYSRSRIQRMTGRADNSFVIENNDIQRSVTTNIMAGVDFNFLQSSKRSSSLQVRVSYMENQDIVGQVWEHGLHNRQTLGGFGWKDIKAWPEVLLEDPDAFFQNDRKFIIAGATDIDWRAEFDRDGDGVLDFGGDTEAAALRFKEFISSAFSDYDHTPIKPRVYHGPWGIYSGYFKDQLDYKPSVYFSHIGDKKYNFKVDWDNQLDRYNRTKAGIDLHLFDNNNYNAGWSNPTLTTIDNKPIMLSAYIQNRLDLGDFVLDAGLRMDMVDPKGDEVSPYKNGILLLTERQTRKLTEFAPRIGVAFPVTDRTQMRFSFGHFYQPPSWRFLLIGDMFGSQQAVLDFSRTTMYEAGFTTLLSEELCLDLVGYYRNIDGDFAYRRVRHPDNPEVSRVAITNMDYGNVKGVDASIQWRYGNYLSTRVNYTLQFARNTGSSVSSIVILSIRVASMSSLEVGSVPVLR